MYDSDSCTNSNKHTLVVLRGTVNDKPVSCLVDSGATHNFLSLNWTARAGCVTSPLPDKLHVDLADGRKMLYLSEEASVELCIGDFRFSLQGILALWEWPGKTSERSWPRGRGKDSLPEWVRAGPCCLPHRTRQASSSPNFNRSLRWFVVLLALLSRFLVARATRNCRYSCPVQRYWLKKHAQLQLQLRIVHVHACMHTTVRRSVVGIRSALWLVREFVRWGWLFLLLWSVDTSFGAYFFLPQLAIELTSTPTMLDSSRHRSSILLTTAPGNHVKHSFRKARQLWTLKLPSPCDYFEKRRKEQQGKSFSAPNRQS